MNIIRSLVSRRCFECGREPEKENMPNVVFAQYGMEPDIENEWKNIIKLTSPNDAKKAIDKLLDKMEENSVNNGFISKDQDVFIGCGQGFVMDDREIYYLFFSRLRHWNQRAIDEKRENIDGKIIFKAIKETVDIYLGKSNSKSREKRKEFTQMSLEDDSEHWFPSIKLQKRQGTGLCTEMAAISHNLWLLAGRESFFITSKECDIATDDPQYKNDGHSFCVVNTGTKINLFDLALDHFCEIGESPIEMLKRGVPIKYKNDIYVTECSSQNESES